MTDNDKILIAAKRYFEERIESPEILTSSPPQKWLLMPDGTKAEQFTYDTEEWRRLVDLFVGHLADFAKQQLREHYQDCGRPG